MNQRHKVSIKTPDGMLIKFNDLRVLHSNISYRDLVTIIHYT